MPQESEILVIDISHEAKVRLYGHITSQMKNKGFNPVDYKSLDLGFELPVGWPVDKDCKLTLSQLVVLAVKLGMRIYINDLSIEPHGYLKEKR